MVDAEGAEESKDNGIRKLCLARQRLLWRAWVSKTFGFATDFLDTSDESAARTLPKASLIYFPQDPQLDRAHPPLM